jgi:hypothetical protein
MGRWDGVTITLPGGGERHGVPATADRGDDAPAVLGVLGTGVPSMFEPLGFRQVGRGEPGRPAVRVTVG